jgi:copper(I)-binding protein
LKALFLFVLLILAPGAAHAHEIRYGELEIVHPTVDEAYKGQAVAQGSMEIRNQGKAVDKLLSINAEFAERGRIEISDTTVAPGGRILVPIAFENINRKLSELEVYDGELIFENAGTIEIEFMVHPHPHSSKHPAILALGHLQPSPAQ